MEKKEIKTAVKRINKENFMNVISLMTVIVGVVVFSFASVGFDISKIGTARYWTSVAILIALSVYGLPAGKRFGANYLETAANGAFKRSQDNFYSILNTMSQRGLTGYFREYLNFFYERKKKNIQRDLIAKVKGVNPKILMLNDVQFETLKTAPLKIEDTYFAPLTCEQFDSISAIRQGKFELETLPPEYFTTELTNGTFDADKRLKNANETKHRIIVLNFAYKLILSIAISMIFGAFAVGSAYGGVSQAIADTIMRLIQLTTALMMGFYTQFEVNKIDIDVLQEKKDRIELYLTEYDKRIFIPTDLNEEAKKVYEEYMAQQDKLKAEEEAKKIPLNNKDDGVIEITQSQLAILDLNNKVTA